MTQTSMATITTGCETAVSHIATAIVTQRSVTLPTLPTLPTLITIFQ